MVRNASPTLSPNRGAAREQAILEATFDLLAEVGYERLTGDAVAGRARASKTTIYKRWSNKAELVVAALRHHEPISIERTDTGSLRGDLLTLLQLLRTKFSGPNHARVSSLLHAMGSHPDLAAAFRAYLLPHRTAMAAEIVRRAQSRGELPAGANPDLVLDVVPGAIFTRIMLTGEPVDDGYLGHVVDNVLIPLLTGPGTAR